MRILILEDDPLIALDLQLIVEDCGCRVGAACGSLAEARLALASAARGADRYDFAFLDVDLPDGRSFELAAALQEARTPFAFVSASRPGDLPERLRGERFVAKPYAPAAIRNSLSAVRQAA